jgi:hypothetical protein
MEGKRGLRWVRLSLVRSMWDWCAPRAQITLNPSVLRLLHQQLAYMQEHLDGQGQICVEVACHGVSLLPVIIVHK